MLEQVDLKLYQFQSIFFTLSFFLFNQIEKDPILIHMLVAENVKYPYEYLLRSVLKHLVDATTNEFLFVLEFFKTNPKDTFNR